MLHAYAIEQPIVASTANSSTLENSSGIIDRISFPHEWAYPNFQCFTKLNGMFEGSPIPHKTTILSKPCHRLRLLAYLKSAPIWRLLTCKTLKFDHLGSYKDLIPKFKQRSLRLTLDQTLQSLHFLWCFIMDIKILRQAIFCHRAFTDNHQIAAHKMVNAK